MNEEDNGRKRVRFNITLGEDCGCIMLITVAVLLYLLSHIVFSVWPK